MLSHGNCSPNHRIDNHRWSDWRELARTTTHTLSCNKSSVHLGKSGSGFPSFLIRSENRTETVHIARTGARVATARGRSSIRQLVGLHAPCKSLPASCTKNKGHEFQKVPAHISFVPGSASCSFRPFKSRLLELGKLVRVYASLGLKGNHGEDQGHQEKCGDDSCQA